MRGLPHPAAEGGRVVSRISARGVFWIVMGIVLLSATLWATWVILAWAIGRSGG